MSKINQKKLNHKYEICKSQLQSFQIEIEPFDPSKNQTLVIFHNGKSDKEDLSLLSKIIKEKIYFIPGRNFCYVQNTAYLKFFDQFQDEKYYKNIDLRTLFGFITKSISFDQMYHKEKLYNNVPNATTSFNIPGLHLIQNFLTPELEASLIEQIDQGTWISMARRKVQHFGYDFIYGENTVYLEQPSSKNIPQYCQNILPNIYQAINQIFPDQNIELQQLTINDYEPGEGIPPHIDVHGPFKEIFVSLSLSSGCVMTFQNAYQLENKQHIFFPQRSLMIFSGEARYAWYHSIATRKMDLVDEQGFCRDRRISITLRQIQNKKCECKYKEFCDSQDYDAKTMNIHNNVVHQK